MENEKGKRTEKPYLESKFHFLVRLSTGGNSLWFFGMEMENDQKKTKASSFSCLSLNNGIDFVRLYWLMNRSVQLLQILSSPNTKPLQNSEKSESNPDPKPDPEAGLKAKSKAEAGSHNEKSVVSQNKDDNPDNSFPTIIHKKQRRGQMSGEAVSVEDFIRDSLEHVGLGIRAADFFEQHPIMNEVGEDGFEIDWEGERDLQLEDFEGAGEGDPVILEFSD
ncbi:hypothetical protein DITRI_Ditri11bG0074400 [Diplodiscus trichospermus]